MKFLNFSTLNYKICMQADKPYIFDIIRKKYVRLTPEELARQHLVHYLTQSLAYPKSLISIERHIHGHYRTNRPDLVAYNKHGNPCLVAECKAAHIPLTEDIYIQLARYNRQLKAPILVITNGQEYGCWRIHQEKPEREPLDTIPAFDSLS